MVGYCIIVSSALRGVILDFSMVVWDWINKVRQMGETGV